MIPYSAKLLTKARESAVFWRKRARLALSRLAAFERRVSRVSDIADALDIMSTEPGEARLSFIAREIRKAIR